MYNFCIDNLLAFKADIFSISLLLPCMIGLQESTSSVQRWFLFELIIEETIRSKNPQYYY
uniref:Uncharacterized protein n=1 Tax=Arion vulgaris TaxID=1028688 RepID=A0A0B6ZSK2_9EUPU